MVTSFSTAKEQDMYVEYLKDWCKIRGITKSFIIARLVQDWAETEMAKESKCTTSTR